ncbi:MAG: hypothetical protein ACI8RE_003045, partial [Ilumatobacter sp.]
MESLLDPSQIANLYRCCLDLLTNSDARQNLGAGGTDYCGSNFPDGTTPSDVTRVMTQIDADHPGEHPGLTAICAAPPTDYDDSHDISHCTNRVIQCCNEVVPETNILYCDGDERVPEPPPGCVEHMPPEHMPPEHMPPEHMPPEHMPPEHMPPEHM